MKQVKNESKRRWSNYFIELLIVIIGISVAFWLNKMGERNQNRLDKISYLKDIKHDLQTDSLRLTYNIKNNEAKIESLTKALEFVEKSAPIDSLLMNMLQIGNYDFFKPDNFTLTSLLQSGDLKLIDSDEIKKELLRLLKIYESIDFMQKNFLQALDDNYFPMLLTKIDMVNFQPIEPDFFYSIKMKNYCAFTLQETATHIDTYKMAQSRVNKLMKLIDEELEK